MCVCVYLCVCMYIYIEHMHTHTERYTHTHIEIVSATTYTCLIHKQIDVITNKKHTHSDFNRLGCVAQPL